MASHRRGSLHALSAGILVVFAGAIVARPAAAVPSFTGIGFIPDGYYESRVFALSADGLVAVGTAFDPYEMGAVRWTSAGGLASLGVPTFAVDPGYPAATQARDASYDGSIIVGNAGEEAFLWTATGFVTLGHLPPLPPGNNELWRESAAVAVSGDGALVAGYTDHVIGCPPGSHVLVCGRTRESFVWTQAGGIVPFANGNLVGISAAGDVIVGYGAGGGFRLSVSDGLQSLPPTAEGGIFFANAVSADGSAAVGGNVVFPPNTRSLAARWTAEDGSISLGTLPGPGVRASTAFAVSGDGGTVVGWSGIAAGLDVGDGRAFVWDEAHGMRDLAAVLTNDLGLDLTGWTLIKATDVSSDGNVIAGYGLKSGNYQGFVAVIPEPSQNLMLLAGLALLGVLGLRRARASGAPFEAGRQLRPGSSS